LRQILLTAISTPTPPFVRTPIDLVVYLVGMQSSAFQQSTDWIGLWIGQWIGR
jgi:hypothetical protein